MSRILRIPLSLFALVTGLALVCNAGAEEGKKAEKGLKTIRTADCVYVPSPNDVVEKMIEVAKIKKDDLVYDLGCGDGRMVVLAAKKCGCKGIGYEIDPQRVAEARKNVSRKKVEKLVSIQQEDIFKLDVSKATVFLLYLLPDMQEKLIPQFEKCPPGVRIVTHNYPIPGIEADKTEEFKSNEDNVRHTILIYTTPLKKEKRE
jgi:SAM-dependent methyltransferase